MRWTNCEKVSKFSWAPFAFEANNSLRNRKPYVDPTVVRCTYRTFSNIQHVQASMERENETNRFSYWILKQSSFRLILIAFDSVCTKTRNKNERKSIKFLTEKSICYCLFSLKTALNNKIHFIFLQSFYFFYLGIKNDNNVSVSVWPGITTWEKSTLQHRTFSFKK